MTYEEDIEVAIERLSGFGERDAGLGREKGLDKPVESHHNQSDSCSYPESHTGYFISKDLRPL